MRASTPSHSPWRTGSAAAGPAVPVGAGQPVLRAQHLSKSYHSPVLRDLDLDVEQGQFVAIMGPSGSGKSTLLHCLSGMDQPDTGSVLLGGQEITSLSEKELAALRLTRFGFVFQQAHLMTTLCLLDNIVLPGFLAGLRPRSEVTARGEELMERMGIAELATSGVTEVSGGQLQRAGICRALINNPGIVFAGDGHRGPPAPQRVTGSSQWPPQPQPPPPEAEAETSRRPSRLPALCPGVTPCGAPAPRAVVTAEAMATASTTSGEVCAGSGR